MAANSQPAPSIDSLCQCPKCQQRMDDPRVFECGHSICYGCAGNLEIRKAATKDAYMVTCPFCKCSNQLKSEGIESLPSNHALKLLINGLKETAKTDKYKCADCNEEFPVDRLCVCSACDFKFFCGLCMFKEHSNHPAALLPEYLDHCRGKLNDWRAQLAQCDRNDFDFQYAMQGIQGNVPSIEQALVELKKQWDGLIRTANEADVKRLVWTRQFDRFIIKQEIKALGLISRKKQLTTEIQRVATVLKDANDMAYRVVPELRTSALAHATAGPPVAPAALMVPPPPPPQQPRVPIPNLKLANCKRPAQPPPPLAPKVVVIKDESDEAEVKKAKK